MGMLTKLTDQDVLQTAVDRVQVVVLLPGVLAVAEIVVVVMVAGAVQAPLVLTGRSRCV